MMQQTTSERILKRKRLSSSLCSHCALMLSLSGVRALCSTDGYAYPSKSNIRSSANTGCKICLIIYCTVSRTLKEDEPLKFFSFPHSDNASQDVCVNTDSLPNHLWGYSVRESYEYILLHLRLAKSEASLAAEAIPAPQIKTDLSNQRAIDTAKQWIAECKASHRQCHISSTPQLPSRVVDVGPALDGQSVNLHVTNPQSPEYQEYVALSYCWGGPQFITTTLATLQDLRTGIEVARLPQTIQDAIEVTRKLGFRFLWIDSLCIVQDSDSDKEYEIDNMGKIYKSATVTIAAGVPSSANEGFLRALRNPWLVENVSQPFPYQETMTLSVAGFKPYSLQLPLHSRGWAFQEDLLSRRVLIYEDLDLTWRCQTGQRKSYLGIGISGHDRTMRLPAGVFQSGLPNKISNTTRNARHHLWNDLIYNYTLRRLTDKDDRLRALAGVAHELAKHWGDKYLLGLWQNCIIEQLLWFCVPGHERQTRRSPRAPTWSWASLDCHVGFLPTSAILAFAEETSDGPTSNEIKLICKVISKTEIPRGCLWNCNNSTDVAEDDKLDEFSHFLILGKPIRKEGDYVYGLKVVQAGGAQTFQRIGHAELQTFEELTSRQPCVVTLI